MSESQPLTGVTHSANGQTGLTLGVGCARRVVGVESGALGLTGPVTLASDEGLGLGRGAHVGSSEDEEGGGKGEHFIPTAERLLYSS
jgi:hypothetical protein